MENPTPTVQQDIKQVEAALTAWRSFTYRTRYGGLARRYAQAKAAYEAFQRIKQVLTGHTAREKDQTEE